MVSLECMTLSFPLKQQNALNRNICQIRCKQAIHGCRCSSENTLKKLFPAIKHSSLQGKIVFKNNYLGSRPFLYFTEIFVHLSVIAVACYFSVYKLIGLEPVNLYLFKVISRKHQKKVWIMFKVNSKYSRMSFWGPFC